MQWVSSQLRDISTCFLFHFHERRVCLSRGGVISLRPRVQIQELLLGGSVEKGIHFETLLAVLKSN